MKAHIFIPTVAGERRIAQALAALGAGWRERCTVIDNDSRDATADLLRDRFPEVTVLRLPRNFGFGAAINAAVARSDAEIVVVMNDDVVCEPTAIDALIAPFADAAVGMAVGVLLDAENPRRIDSAGVTCDPAVGALDFMRGADIGELDRVAADAGGPLGPTGGLAAYRRVAFDAVGGFDEGFFAYYEDVDLALRLRAAGWASRFVPAARGLHLGSATLGWRSPEKEKIVCFSRGRMIAKYGVLRRPRAYPFLALDVLACVAQTIEHRSLLPWRERVRGYRACEPRSAYPADLVSDRSLVAVTRGRFARRFGWGPPARG